MEMVQSNNRIRGKTALYEPVYGKWQKAFVKYLSFIPPAAITLMYALYFVPWLYNRIYSPPPVVRTFIVFIITFILLKVLSYLRKTVQTFILERLL